MQRLLHLTLRTAAATLAFLALSGKDARADEQIPTSIMLVDPSNQFVGDKYAAEKGSTKHLTAKVLDQNGRQMDADVRWEMDGNAATLVKDGKSAANLTMTKDVFDDPHRYEPWVNIRACVGGLCKWVNVTGVVNLVGNWSIYIKVTNAIAGDQTMTLKFAQNGRNLVCTGTGKQPMTAYLRGTKLQFHDPNKELTAFSGTLTQAGNAQGTWRSFKGYEGRWFAKK